ncbi:MAG: thiamine pyrophosphate-dependent enzyme [Ignavibacteria bacterium]
MIFLTVGSMGHCTQIALGIAIEKKDLQVFVLDGDGAVIMQMGSLHLEVQASVP